MALEPEKQKVAVQMPSRTLRTFRPSFPSIQLPGVQRLARTLDSIGEAEAQATAKETALDQARSVSITGPNGEPVRPPTPDEFGRYAKEIFDKAIDDRYGTAVVMDSQKKIFDIFNENQNDPQKALELAKSHAQGVISAAPPAIRPTLEKQFGSQINSQYRGYTVQASRMDRYNTAVGLKNDIKDLEQKEDNALAQGNKTLADSLNNQIRVKLELLDAQRMLPKGTIELFNQRRLSSRAIFDVHTTTRNRIESGDVDPEDLLKLSKIFDGSAKDTDSVDGYDKAWVNKNVPSIGARENAAKYYAQLYKSYIASATKAQGEVDYHKWSVNPGKNPVPGKTGPAREANLIRYADENYGQDSWKTPQGLQNLFARTGGQIPVAKIKEYLDNPESTSDKDVLQRKAQFYNQLANLQTSDGLTINRSIDISARDRAFYVHYSEGLKSGLDHVKAKDMATKRLDADPKNESVNNPLRFISSKMPSDKPELKKEKGIYKFIDSRFPTKSIVPSILGGPKAVRVEELPQGAKSFILRRMAAHLAVDRTADDSAIEAVKDFQRAWVQVPFNKTRDAASGSGWTPVERAIPAVEVPGKQPDREWVKGLWDRMMKAQKDVDAPDEAYTADSVRQMFISAGKPIPESAKVGVDIYFQGNANGTHTIMYDSGRGVYQVLDRNNQPIIVDLRKYAAQYTENLRIAATNDAEERREIADRIMNQAAKPTASIELGRNMDSMALRRQNVLEPAQKSRYYTGDAPSISSDLYVDYNKPAPEGASSPPPRPSDYKMGLKKRSDVSLPTGKRAAATPVSAENPLEFRNWADTFKHFDALNDDKGYVPRYLGNSSKANGVHRGLVEVMDIAASAMPEGYSVKITPHGGVRTRGSGQHPAGTALDIQIYKGNKEIPNYQDGKAFRIYEQFAQLAKSIQTELYPELNGQFRWGGYFSKDRKPTGYGAIDLMHFDVGSSQNAMFYGTWEGGVRSQFLKILQKTYPGLISRGMK